MKDVLDEIVAHKRVELKHLKQAVPPAMLYNEVEKVAEQSVPSMSRALMESESGIIAEFKRKSPSKGWIMEQGRAEEIPYSYQQNGAAALSILTDEKYFGGRDSFIKTARENKVTLPILYKNFVIDEYQLFQARLCGASAVLLIAADLSLQECRSLLKTAHELNMMLLWNLICAESITAILALLSLMWKTRSVWPNCYRRMYAKSARAEFQIPVR